jgi:hypothetical protein
MPRRFPPYPARLPRAANGHTRKPFPNPRFWGESEHVCRVKREQEDEEDERQKRARA